MPNTGFKNIKKRANKIKNDTILLYLCYKDSRTPLKAKFISVLALTIALSPIDLIPDFIPVIGYVDDIIIIPFLMFIAFKLIPENIISENRQLAYTFTAESRSFRVKAFIIMAGLWACIIGLLLFQIYKAVKNR